MTRMLAAGLAGLVFGFGLALSQMINPAKVLGFLDLAGDWDPSLAFVMLGALAVTAPGYRLVLGRGRPLLAERFELPVRTAIDRRLLGGAALFGIGWGLVGFCPGPAVAALAYGTPQAAVVVAAMVAGAALFHWRPVVAARSRAPITGAVPTTDG